MSRIPLRVQSGTLGAALEDRQAYCAAIAIVEQTASWRCTVNCIAAARRNGHVPRGRSARALACLHRASRSGCTAQRLNSRPLKRARGSERPGSDGPARPVGASVVVSTGSIESKFPDLQNAVGVAILSLVLNLFGGLSEACDFVDLAQNSFCTHPVAHQGYDLALARPPLQGSIGHCSCTSPTVFTRLRLVSRYARVGCSSIHQTGSLGFT